MKSESYIVTDQEEWVHKSILDEYAIKTGKGLDTEKVWEYEDVVEPPAPPKALLNLLDLNTWHKASVEAVANDASGAGWTLTPKPNIENPSLEQEQRAKEFLENQKVKINRLLYQREYDAEALGYGVLEVVREHGNREAPIKELNHYPAFTFRRCADGVRVVQRVGNYKRYFIIMGTNQDEHGVFDVHFETGEKHYEGLPEHLRANELLWLNRHNPESVLYGKAPITPGISSIYGDYNRSRYNIKFFENYGIPAMYVTITGDFDPGILDPTDPDYNPSNTLQARITEQLRSVIHNPHSAMVIQVPSEGEDGNVDVKLEPLSTDTKEASFRLFRKDNRDEVIAAHHVDPNRVGVTDTGKLGASNAEMTNKAYRTTTIKPLLKYNEEEITKLLNVGLGITDWEFKLITTDTDDKQVDIDKTLSLVENGLMTLNEARDLIGEEFGIARLDDNILLDEFYYHGQALRNQFQNNLLPGVDSVLDGLEQSLNNSLSEENEEDVSIKSKERDNQFSRAIETIKGVIKRI